MSAECGIRQNLMHAFQYHTVIVFQLQNLDTFFSLFGSTGRKNTRGIRLFLSFILQCFSLYFMFSSFHPVSVQSLPPTCYQRGSLSSHFSITEGLSTLNIANYWARKLRKSENSDLGSVIHMVILMGSFHKTAFRSKMSVPFAVLYDSTCGTPHFLSNPEDFLTTLFHFHHTTPRTCASFRSTWGWERAPIGFCQWRSSSSWKADGDWHQTFHIHF